MKTTDVSQDSGIFRLLYNEIFFALINNPFIAGNFQWIKEVITRSRSSCHIKFIFLEVKENNFIISESKCNVKFLA
jgi:hypothetical protein